MKVIVFGATGMAGSGVLTECLEDPRLPSVRVVGRNPGGIAHPKPRELIRSDFFDYSGAKGDLTGDTPCFFCLGVSAHGMKGAAYHRLTYELTLSTAEALVHLNPRLAFCYASDEGTDSTERGRFMWARVKGETENHLLRMPAMPSWSVRVSFSRLRCPLEDDAIPGIRHRTRAARPVAEAAAAEPCNHDRERRSDDASGSGQRVLETRA